MKCFGIVLDQKMKTGGPNNFTLSNKWSNKYLCIMNIFCEALPTNMFDEQI